MNSLTFTQIGIIIFVIIVGIMIYTGRRKQPIQPSSSIKTFTPCAMLEDNIYEKNKEKQMQMMNVLYENIGDDIIDYNNKPTGLFVIP